MNSSENENENENGAPPSSRGLANYLKLSLQQELIASDAIISMFVSALKENKTCCVDATEVMDLIRSTPNLFEVLKELNDRMDHMDKVGKLDKLDKLEKVESSIMMPSLNNSKIEWLHWLIVDGLTLRMLDNFEYVRLMSTIDRFDRTKPRPLHIFEIKTAQSNKTRSDDHDVSMARFEFYVGHLSWFYTIVKNGFTMYRCKRNDYIGKKLRLLPDLGTAMRSLQYDDAWCSSMCGTTIGCIALCSYINDPERVRVECNVRNDFTIFEDSDLVTPRFILYYGNRGECVKPMERMCEAPSLPSIRSTVSAQRLMAYTTNLVSKKELHKNLTISAVLALGHFVLPLWNQILS